MCWMLRVTDPVLEVEKKIEIIILIGFFDSWTKSQISNFYMQYCKYNSERLSGMCYDMQS